MAETELAQTELAPRRSWPRRSWPQDGVGSTELAQTELAPRQSWLNGVDPYSYLYLYIGNADPFLHHIFLNFCFRF
uniref:Uncharacterized protein n=1 Tax=Globodera rostochiensis TaxID=31243 RepID=A0A914HWC8_GLORO